MKILNLLEGTEILYHGTNIKSFFSMIRTGSVVLSALTTDEYELQQVKEKSNIRGRMYYLSLARSLHSEFLTSGIYRGNYVVMEFRNRDIAKYGKIIPFNFFNNVERDEMEDRMLSNKSMIPLSAIHKILVVCVDGYVHGIQQFAEKWNIPVEFYDFGSELAMRRSPKTLEERVAAMTRHDPHPVSHRTNDMHQMAQIIDDALDNNFDLASELSSEPDNYAFTELSRFSVNAKDIMWMVRVHDPKLGHQLMLKFKKHGIDTPSKFEDWFATLSSTLRVL